VPAPASPATAPADAISIDTIVEQWVQIRNDVKAVNRRTEALLQQVDPAGIAGDVLVLVSPYEFHRNKVNSDEARTIVEDVLIRRLGQRLTVTCVTREDAQAMIAKRSPSPTAATPMPLSSTEAPATVSALQPTQAKTADRQEPAREAVTQASSDPGQLPAPRAEESTTSETAAPSPFAPDLDETRITAVRNIFDAEDLDEDTEYV
jgi:DNA polymerase-3 subunit gamma/tau